MRPSLTPESNTPAVPAAPAPYGLGRLHKEDVRDRRYLLARPREASTRTFRNWLVPGPVLDQGDTPMCVGYATAKWLAAHPIVNPNVDPVVLYREAQKRDEWDGEDYDGTSTRGVMKYLQEIGLVGEYRWALDLDTAIHHLLETGPMLFGTWWYWDMFSPVKGYLRPTGGEAGGHEWLAVGVNVKRKNPDGTVGAIRMQNSWGAAWSEKGRAWISFEAMRELLDNDPYAEACMATEIKRAA